MRMNTVQHWLKNYVDFAPENEHFYHRTSSGNRGSVTSFHMEKHRISAKVYDPPRATQTLPLPRSGVGALSVTGRPQPTRDPIRERWWAIKSDVNRTRWGVPQAAKSGRQARRRKKLHTSVCSGRFCERVSELSSKYALTPSVRSQEMPARKSGDQFGRNDQFGTLDDLLQRETLEAAR